MFKFSTTSQEQYELLEGGAAFHFPTTPQGVVSLLWEDDEWEFILRGGYDHQVIGVEQIELSATLLTVVVNSVSVLRPSGLKETYTIRANGEYKYLVETFPTSKPCDYDHPRGNPWQGWKDKIKLV